MQVKSSTTQLGRLLMRKQIEARNNEIDWALSWIEKQRSMYAPQSARGQIYKDLTDYFNNRKENLNGSITS